eukprot:4712400-Pleurochrysis_carterae.AAC.1
MRQYESKINLPMACSDLKNSGKVMHMKINSSIWKTHPPGVPRSEDTIDVVPNPNDERECMMETKKN